MTNRLLTGWAKYHITFSAAPGEQLLNLPQVNGFCKDRHQNILAFRRLNANGSASHSPSNQKVLAYFHVKIMYHLRTSDVQRIFVTFKDEKSTAQTNMASAVFFVRKNGCRPNRSAQSMVSRRNPKQRNGSNVSRKREAE